MSDATATTRMWSAVAAIVVAGAYLPIALLTGTVAWLSYLAVFDSTALIVAVPTTSIVIGTGAAIWPFLLVLILLMTRERLTATDTELIRAARIIGAVTAVLIIASLAARRMIPAATLATLLIATCVAILLQMTVVLELAARERAAHRAFYARATLLAALLLAQASLFGWYQGTRIAGADLLGLTRLQRKGETETRRVLFVGTDRVYCVARKERGFEITPVEWDEVESLASPAPR